MTELEQLRSAIHGVARFTATTATIGISANGGGVSLLLTDGSGARSTVVTGPTGSGKTELLGSLYAGAAEAGISSRALIGPADRDAYDVVQHFRSRISAGNGDFGLLLVDDLTGHGDDTLQALAEVAKLAPTAGLTLVVAVQDVRSGSRGGNVLQHLTSANLVRFSGEGGPGVGEVNGVPFRAWWAS